MNCRVCTRCGKCGRYPSAPIVESGAVVLPAPVRRKGLGAAIDLGTTTIVVRVYDLATGELLRQTSTFNPQRQIAADVMGRITAAMSGRLDELRDSVRAAVREGCGGYGLAEAVVVGNTTMLHLFAGLDPSSYATAPFRAERLFGERLELDGVAVRLPRCAHAFFGADAIAAARMSGMCDRDGCELLADIGTNGELALWRQGALTVASVAAGPAFERSGVTGSEIIAAIADGLESGVIDGTGLVRGTLCANLDQSDVRAVQLAKSAVHAGIATLLKQTATPVSSVTRFSLAGGFGSGLDPAKASRIGLFAAELLPVVKVCGNLAIEGASAALLDPSVGDEMDRLAASARTIELGGDADFASAFLRSMSF